VKVGVWHAVSARRIVGPVLLNETINCKRYLQVTLGQFFPQLKEVESPQLTEVERLYGWFRQDSATAHTARMSMQALSIVFMDRSISSGIWPAHSSDLNPCDVFLLGLFEGQNLQQ
jgi:hypothetical protein